MRNEKDRVGEMTDADRQRIGGILYGVAEAVGGNVVWGGKDYLDVCITEHRMAAERKATNRLAFATWGLVFTTCVLVAATVALVIATAAHH